MVYLNLCRAIVSCNTQAQMPFSIYTVLFKVHVTFSQNYQICKNVQSYFRGISFQVSKALAAI